MRIKIGLLIWIGLISGGLLALRQLSDQSVQGLKQLYQYTSNLRHSSEIRFAGQYPLAVGDLVFLDDKTDYTPVGYVSRVGSSPSRIGEVLWADSAEVTFYANAPVIGNEDLLTYHQPPDDLGWVIQTMLPAEKRAQIIGLIMQTYLEEQRAITEALRPIVTDSLADATEIIGQDLRLAFEKRQDRFRSIGQRYQLELVENQIVPLIKEEIWPIVREESEDLANQMGREIWKEISLFRFAWRYLYDQSGLPEKSFTQQELDRFLQTKVAPIIESHVPDMIEVQNRIVARVSRSQRTQQTFFDAAHSIANDQEIKDLIGEIFREVMLDNQTLKDSLASNWNSPQARQALNSITHRIEPTVSEIGLILFGSADGEITPEFARVLRHRILQKDRRWFTLKLAEGDPHLDRTLNRTSGPTEITVEIADPIGSIPYAPARNR